MMFSVTLQDIVEIVPDMTWGYLHHLPARANPPPDSFVGGALTCPAFVVVDDDGERTYAFEQRERSDRASRAERPYGMKTGLACGQACFEPFPDRQPIRDGVIGVDLDGGELCAAKHPAIEFAAVTIKERPLNCARNVAANVGKERDHPADCPTIKLEGGMEPNDVTNGTMRKGEPACSEIVLDNRAMGTFRSVPDAKGKCGSIIIARYCAASVWRGRGSALIRRAETKPGTHMIPTSNGAVASKAVDDEAIAGIAIELDR
jgi:hypothetical protein